MTASNGPAHAADTRRRARPVLPEEQRLRVLLVEDHAVVREGLASLLEQSGLINVTGQAGTIEEGLRELERHDVNMVVLDLRLGEENGVEFVRTVRARGLEVPILILSAHDTTTDLHRALAAGANGYVLKGSDGEVLTRAVLDTASGQTVIDPAFVPQLIRRGGMDKVEQPTPRELEVLQLIANGEPVDVIADTLRISPRTVHKHMEHLFKKLEVSNRAELVSVAFRRGYIR